MTDEPFRTNDRRVILWLLVGLLVLFGGVYVAGYLLTSDRVPRGTTVSGVAIGGLRPAAAESRLTDELAERRTAPIVVTAFGERGRVRPERAGLDVDIAASVAQAGGGRSWHPARIWDSLTGGDELDAVVRVDEAALREELSGFTREVDVPAREGRVVFRRDTAVPRPPRSGEVVDLDAALDVVRQAYLSEDAAPVELPVATDEPEVDKADVSSAMEEFANPAVSGPVVLVLGGERVVLRPQDFVPALSLVAEDGELAPRLDEKRLFRGIEPRIRGAAFAPRDATVRLVDGQPRVVPARRGLTFDRAEVAESFLDVVVAEGGARTLRVETVVDKPDFTTAEARALGIVEEVSEFTTYYPHAEYRNVNQGRAAELIDGTVLVPGEVFSLNEIVGERTPENGFTKGFIISDGIFKEDFGGGVSQVATTTFNAMFFAGLEDVEHKPHSFYIDRYPVGREATVAWPYVDLKFRNDTDYGVLVQAWVVPSTPSRSGEMHVRMWSTKQWRITAGRSARYNFTKPETRRLSGPDCVPQQGSAGFEIDVYRNFFRPGSDRLVRRETFHTTYIPSDEVICE